VPLDDAVAHLRQLLVAVIAWPVGRSLAWRRDVAWRGEACTAVC
jgi:hypothetical protein